MSRNVFLAVAPHFFGLLLIVLSASSVMLSLSEPDLL